MSVVFITGAAGGLGQALAIGLKADHSVIVSDIEKSNIDDLANKIGCESMICDVSDWGSIDFVISAVISKYGKIDVLINNAGLYCRNKVENIDPSFTQKLFMVNTVGPLLMAKAVVPHMRAQGGGHIINVNSIGGVSIKDQRSAYYGSKWGLTGISKHLKQELKADNIKVTDLRPSALEQTMSLNGQVDQRDSYLSYDEIVSTIKFILERNNTTIISELGIEDISFA